LSACADPPSAAPEKPKAELQAVPAPAQSADGDVVFGDGKRRGDHGLKPIDPPKRFDLPAPDVFSGFKIFLWGISIAGVFVGLFLAVVVVVFTLRFLRRTAVPAVTGLPASPSILEAGVLASLQIMDHVTKKLEERREELLAEQAEIDKRLKGRKPVPRKTKAKP
jgi:hypothetical protein